MTLRARCLLLPLLFLALPQLAAAQEDVLTGRVVGPDGGVLPGVRVEAISVETEIARTGLTDERGRYMIIFPDGGGRYVLRFTYLGMAEVVQTVAREAGEELLVANAALQVQAIALDTLRVRAPAPTPGQGRTGEQTMSLNQELLNRLPLPDLDPATAAQLAAGVISTELDSLSGRMGFSVAGMSDLLNQVTLDGALMGEEALGVPEEGVRQTQITTSTFDASRGGFAGGLVSMTSARGTNRRAGSFSYRLEDDALQLRPATTTNAFTRHNIGGSWGAPLIQNRLFYNASFQLGRTVNHRFALSASDPEAAQRSGVNPDSIARFLDILEAGYGVPVAGQTGPYDQTSQDLRLQGRLDWHAVQRRTMSQTLSMRFNLTDNRQDSTRIRELDLAERGGDTERDNAMVSLSLSSRFRTRWTNSLRASWSRSASEALPFTIMPEGSVRITSDFEDGTRDTRSLSFGGNRSMPTEASSRDLQLSNDLSLLLPLGAHLHRLKVGGQIQRTRDVNRSMDNLFGSFSYGSLSALEANAPDRYERALTERSARTGRVNTGLYVGDTWRISQPLELTFGLRWDRTRLEEVPARNPAVEEAFGRRTDVLAQASGLSPRVGFSYRLSGPQQPPRSLTGGIGVFAGRAPTSLFTQAFRQTGLPDAEQRLVCIGDAVPTPDWDLYIQDPAAVPTACADGGAGLPPGLSSRARAVTLLDPDQGLPSSLRAEVGYRARLATTLNGSVRYLYSRGFGLWSYRDLNLDESRAFTLGGEGRPFFGDPSAIVASTGAVSMASSRRHAEFGNVWEVGSELASEAHQLTADLMGMVTPRNTLLVSYTLGFARDQGSSGVGFGFGGFGGVSVSTPTAGSPNDVEWAPGSNDRRHTLNVTLSHALRPSIEVSAMARVGSGSPFTPLVNRDINGDGLRNDRAFVFDPASADPTTAAAMERLLATVPGRVRDCLESQLGAVAERNSCRNGWTQSLDLRASLRPELPRIERRLTVSIDARNVLTGLDQLVHGRSDMRGWGEGRRADGTLLYVRGFDPATQRFQYEVNEGFGQTRRGSSAFRNPFALTISARVLVGGQPQLTNRGFGGRGGMIAMRGMGGGRVGGGGGVVFGGDIDPAAAAAMREVLGALRGSGGDAGALLDAAFSNPPRQLLALRDSLALSDAQVVALRALADSLDARHAPRREALAPVADSLLGAARAGGVQPQQLMQRVQAELAPELGAARQRAAEALRLAEAELTPEQRERVPARLRALARGERAGGGFNAVGMLDRLLANPLPVLLELRDTIGLSAEQVARIEALSAELQADLDRRRADLGRRLDGVDGSRQARILAELQPEIERARGEVTAALREVERLLTREQWERVPEQVRNPFRASQGRRRR